MLIFWILLYLIEILHQTTTFCESSWIAEGLYLIEILHQTTTERDSARIQPQLYLIEILHQTTTIYSNIFIRNLLYLIEILHQTTTVRLELQFLRGCILSKFYIKPQLPSLSKATTSVVSYRNSTSNHNCYRTWRNIQKLYLIEILHQTTTASAAKGFTPRCILSKFYIKPQPLARVRELVEGCILSKFYIKPQPAATRAAWFFVVSYRNSTSNHNLTGLQKPIMRLYLIEILHQTTTYRNRSLYRLQLSLIEILHQTTTANGVTMRNTVLYLIEILHQTTTAPWTRACSL